MPPTGSIFTDWQQLEKESRLLMNEDFSWSEPPARSRRRAGAEPIAVRRRTAMVELEPARGSWDRESWDQPTEEHSHFDEMMDAWNAEYGDGAGYEQTPREERPAAFDLSDPGMPAAAQSGRRTVVITGRGDDRYIPAPRRRPSSDLRFHERSTFSPDRAGLWAVLLGIALLIGCVVH